MDERLGPISKGLWLQVFSFLDNNRYYSRLRLLSKKFYDIVNSPGYWHNIIIKDEFGIIPSFNEKLLRSLGEMSSTLDILEVKISEEFQGKSELFEELLKLTNLVSLKVRVVKEDYIEVFNFYSLLCDIIKNNPKMRSLTLSCFLHKGVISGLTDTLQEHPSLEVIDFSNNRISTYAAVKIASIIRESKKLRKLDLSYNDIEDQGAHWIVDALKSCETLEYLNLDWNMLSVEAVRILSLALKTGTSLKEVNMMRRYTDYEIISEIGIGLLASGLFTCTTLKSFTLNLPEYRSASKLAEGFSAGSSLEDLTLHKMDDQAALKICSALKELTTLKRLDLSGPGMQAEALNELAGAIRSNPLLENLRVECDADAIDDAGDFGLALSNLARLRRLQVSYPGITARQMADLLSTLGASTSIQYLSLSCSTWEGETSQALIKLAKGNKTLRYLTIIPCEIIPTNLEGIHLLLAQAQSLKSLELFYPGPEATSSLLKALNEPETSPKFESLYILGGVLEAEGVDHLCHYVQSSSSALQKLYLPLCSYDPKEELRIAKSVITNCNLLGLNLELRSVQLQNFVGNHLKWNKQWRFGQSGGTKDERDGLAEKFNNLEIEVPKEKKATEDERIDNQLL